MLVDKIFLHFEEASDFLIQNATLWKQWNLNLLESFCGRAER